MRGPERDREEAPGMRVFHPGEKVPEVARPATTHDKYAPLDAPPQPITRIVGRRRVQAERS